MAHVQHFVWVIIYQSTAETSIYTSCNPLFRLSTLCILTRGISSVNPRMERYIRCNYCLNGILCHSLYLYIFPKILALSFKAISAHDWGKKSARQIPSRAPTINKTWTRSNNNWLNEGLFEAWKNLNSKTTEHLHISTLGAALTNCKIPFATSYAQFFFWCDFWKKRPSKEISVLKKSHSDGMTELNSEPFFPSFFEVFKTLSYSSSNSFVPLKELFWAHFKYLVFIILC